MKVLAVRSGRDLSVTVAMPFLAPLIRAESEYFKRKDRVQRVLADFLKRKTEPTISPRMYLNMLDHPGAGEAGTYLTLLGTSAAAGKNPVAHVGKIYNVLAQVLAEDIHKKVQGLLDVTVWITSQIGKPISSPQALVVEVTLADGTTRAVVRPQMQREVQLAFTHMKSFCKALTRGLYAVC